MGNSSIRASKELLDELHSLKERGDSYEDVIWRLLEEGDGSRDEGTHDAESPPRVRDEEPATLDVEHTAIDVPGSGELEQRRKETIVEMARLLRDRGSAEKADFLEVVDADRVGYQSKDSFWSNCVKGRESLKAVPGVRKPPQGRNEWTWTADSL